MTSGPESGQTVGVADDVVEVATDHDYFDRHYVRQWAERALLTLPQRLAFFDAIAAVAAEAAAVAGPEVRVLELGSGPGFLAERLLDRCPISSYWLFDFAPLMHELARDRLAKFGARAVFVDGDFSQPEWQQALEPERFELVVSVQAVHELRHASRATDFYRRAASLLRPRGILAVCDLLKRTDDDRPLFLTAAEQLGALRSAGLGAPRVALADARLGLFVARAPGGAAQGEAETS